MTFRTVLQLHGKTATGFSVPESIVTALGKGKRPPVYVTIHGYTYRSTIAPMGGEFMLPLSAENRTGAGLQAGDEFEVSVRLDEDPRIVPVPPELEEAFDQHPRARAAFESLSNSAKKDCTLPVATAKTDETRQRRVDRAIAELESLP